LKKKEMGNF
jgi:hypothetical protein